MLPLTPAALPEVAYPAIQIGARSRNAPDDAPSLHSLVAHSATRNHLPLCNPHTQQPRYLPTGWIAALEAGATRGDGAPSGASLLSSLSFTWNVKTIQGAVAQCPQHSGLIWAFHSRQKFIKTFPIGPSIGGAGPEVRAVGSRKCRSLLPPPVRFARPPLCVVPGLCLSAPVKFVLDSDSTVTFIQHLPFISNINKE